MTSIGDDRIQEKLVWMVLNLVTMTSLLRSELPIRN